MLIFSFGGGNSRLTDILVPPENFYQVSEKVYRSGQPTLGEMKWLEAQGIKMIINLREYYSDSDSDSDCVKGTKLDTFHVKMMQGRINDKDLIEVLRKINSTSDPVLVHCWHGSNYYSNVSANILNQLDKIITKTELSYKINT